MIRMMMIDENGDVNGANGIGVFGECEDWCEGKWAAYRNGDCDRIYVLLLGNSEKV
jgi:hypothetical protein